MWTTTLAWLLLAFVLLENVLSQQDPPARKKVLKQEQEELKELLKTLDKDTRQWRKGWKATEELKRQKLTTKQQQYWRKLSEFPVKDNECPGRLRDRPGKRSVPDDNKEDMHHPIRIKRTGPLIPEPRRIRREWRHMRLAEKRRFINAFNSIAASVPDPDQDPDTTVFNIFVLWHRGSSAPGAHQGPSFLPWHREFLWRMSNALRLQGFARGLDLPYWDSALDQHLPNPRDAAIWIEHPEGIGNNDGILGAPFNESVTTQVINCSEGAPVVRNARFPPTGKTFLYTRTKYETIMGKECYDHLCQNTDGNMEGFHNTGHVFVGGTMAGPACSPGDPVFWLHHTNVDCLWEEYRQTQQDGQKRTLEYPLRDLGRRPSVMAWDSLMFPFDDWGLRNIHGLSNHYTNYYYTCAQRPSDIHCRRSSDCHREGVVNHMLWCDVPVQFCVSKIREGGQCNNSWPHEQCFCTNRNDRPRCNATAHCNCI